VLVFEGAQGLLLSEKHGVMPFCTPSDPGSSIPAAYCNSLGVTSIDIVYVTRAYATRHGAGPLVGEEAISEQLLDNTGETNVMNTHQGPFRKSWNLQASFKAIDMDYQMFAEVIDEKSGVAVSAMVTCLDQLASNVRSDTLSHIMNELQLDYYYLSMGPSRKSTVLVGG
jgi:adenylosuccinate synthase